MIYHFRFGGSARLSELVHTSTKCNRKIVKDAIKRKLCGRSPLMEVLEDNIQVDFLLTEDYYIICVDVDGPDRTGDERESMEAHIEGLLSEALRELFGDGVSSF